ncbi:MAG: 50S ribosomal protein L23 [Calditrichales bacterium]|nr:MAG: 50S ribosomal protein L23 [Calditrichales bacterium]
MKNVQILVRPLYTEKIARLQDSENKYAFEVYREANKIEICKEIEKRFDVKVTDIQTMNVRGKIRQQMSKAGRFHGRRPDWKKAIVTLAEGNKIDLFENA